MDVANCSKYCLKHFMKQYQVKLFFENYFLKNLMSEPRNSQTPLTDKEEFDALVEYLNDKTKREVKEILYDKGRLEYEEIIKQIMNKSHLVFVFDYYNEQGNNYQYIIYIEEKINYYDNYITHLNTNSFISDNKKHNLCIGFSVESTNSNNLFSVKYKEKCKTYEIKFNKKGGQMICATNYCVGRFRIIEMKKTQKELEKDEEENKSTNKLERYSMLIITKYLNSVNDCINIEKACKEYNGIIEQFRYNPVPLNSVREREIFKNIETLHFYDESDKRIREIINDDGIKQIIHWRVSYSYWLENKSDEQMYRKSKFKNIEYGKNDTMKYLYDCQLEESTLVTEYSNDGMIILKNKNVVLGEGMTSIGDYSFRQCNNLQQIHFPNSVNTFGNYCFSFCNNLADIHIPTSVTSFGNYCFSYCSNLRYINIPQNVKRFGDGCFICCVALKLTLPTSITYIGNECFRNCQQIKEMVIPSCVSSIGNYCFSDCTNLTSLRIPSSVTSIGEHCFSSCNNLKKRIQIDINNPIYCINKTNGTRILRRDNGKEIKVWWL